MDRRELLKMIVAATGAAMVGLPALVQGQAPAGATKIHFSDADVGTLDEIAETILPRTRTPGAKDAGAGLCRATCVSEGYTARQQAALPARTDISKRLQPAQIKDKIRKGGGLMPPFPQLSQQEIDDIASYLAK